jgi:hypothetical protein
VTIADNLINGSIDMHVHFSPDSLQDRRQSALQLAQTASQLGMKALVLKSREYNTVPVANLVNEVVPQVLMFGSLTLDSEVGGLNPAAVLAAARMGAKIIWMPTFTSVNSRARTEKALGFKLAGNAITLLGPDNRLLPEVKEIIQIIKQHDIILATGHIAPKEIFALVEEARQAGVAKIIITHVLQGPLMDSSLNAEEILRLAKMGAYIEHSFWAWMPTMGRSDPALIVESIRSTGAERCIMSSDFGQHYNPPAPEGLRLFVATMLKYGIPEKDIKLMIRTNPSRLLGLVQNP